MQTREVLSFGPFRLVASERLLTRGGAPVKLSARALDILTALLSQQNAIVSKRDLRARVWPDTVVDDGSLRFHICGLRKALSDGRDGARYITTVAGRGYCFVAPIQSSTDPTDGPMASVDFPRPSLPPYPTGMVGRDDDVLRLSTLLTAARFVTIVGGGGIGKTTVAVAVAHHVVSAFAGGALFVDLSVLDDPELVPATLASTLGLMVHSDDGTTSLIAYLRDKKILLIFDTCEHLVDAVAQLASRIFMSAPQVHILATSRELLQTTGEYVYKLETLACPADDQGVSVAVVREFPATRLFLERAIANGVQLHLGAEEAAIVVGICQKLDGVPLAIELAARRVGAYGLQQTAALLDQRLTLSWRGPRTAPLRQKTLQATLDWSFGLLSETERIVLRRLAIFVGHFKIDAALEVVTCTRIDRAVVFATIDNLVAKSMVATDAAGSTMRYRLLDTTRAYALETGMNEDELSDLSARHATYCQRWLEQSGAEWPTQSGAGERASHLAALGNVRAALEWCFGANGSLDLGIALATAAAPVFLALSLLKECQRWSERALLSLDESNRGGAEEMHLQSALAMSLMFTRGSTDATQAALRRGFSIAEMHGDAVSQLQRLGSLQMLSIRLGDVKTTLDYARRSIAVATTAEDAAAMALARSMLGIALHLAGDLESARTELEAALRAPRSQRTGTISLGFEHHNRDSIILARTLWLLGYADQAVDCAHNTIADATGTENPVTLYVTLVWAIPMFLWIGDLGSVETYTEKFLAHAESHSIGPYLAVGRGLNGALAIRRDQASRGIEDLRSCLDDLRSTRYELMTTVLSTELAQGLGSLGRVNEAIKFIDETIDLVSSNGNFLFMPEVLRVKGRLSLLMAESLVDDAEACFLKSLEWSRRQGARTWELRTATDLAALWVDRNRADVARLLLRPVFEQFAEGLDTADLKNAERLLGTIG